MYVPQPSVLANLLCIIVIGAISGSLFKSFNIYVIRSENDLKKHMHKVLAIPIPTATPLRHLGSLGENFLVNNCGMYDSF